MSDEVLDPATNPEDQPEMPLEVKPEATPGANAKTTPEVVIVGAGPGGALLAHILLSHGISVTLIERHSDFAREFRGEILMPSGVAALETAGLGDLLVDTPTRRPNAIELYYRDQRAARIEFSDIGESGPVMISQPHMLEALVERCSKKPGFRFLRGTTVTELSSEGGRINGIVTSEGDRYCADLVIGTDGRGSIVRRRAGLHLEESTEAFDVVWFKCPYPGSLADRGSPVMASVGGGHLNISHLAATGELQMASIIPKGSYRNIREAGLDGWFDEIRHRVPAELGDFALAHRDQITHPFVLNVVCHMLPRWTVPGALILGDAAHPMSPVGGQGINIALRDVIVAANQLVPVLLAGGGEAAIDSACMQVERLRIPEVEKIQGIQRMPPRLLFRDRWWSEALIRIGLRLAGSGLPRRTRRLPAVVETLLYGDGEVKLELPLAANQSR
jgi:2-polyprenyl-6-methoxyphenol hydroxylase-like FAD-dependent oxidoreductase